MTNRQREFQKLYDQLCYRFNRHEVWQDVIQTIACSISNAVDKRHYDEREALYMRIVQKYGAKEFAIIPKLFGQITLGMEEKLDGDFLGELYMELGLGNKYAGQFFTPYSLCKGMAEVTLEGAFAEDQLKQHGYISVNDCACGAGATLVAAANVLRERGVNYQQDVIFVGQDIDYGTALMCYIQLSLLGCPGYVRIGDTLANPQTGHVLFGSGESDTWYTPMFFSGPWEYRRSAVMVARMKNAIQAMGGKEPEVSTVKIDTAKEGQLMMNWG